MFAANDAAQVSRAQLRRRKLRHGFKAEAKRRSLQLRRANGIGELDAVDCYWLARALDIDVVRLSELPESSHTRHLRETSPDVMSAATITLGDSVAIWVNDSHALPRQMSNLAHEIGHLEMQHDAAPFLSDHGCRDHYADLEAEADYFGSVLLVTDAVALTVARSGEPLDEAARRYGVSRPLMQWRVNDSGAAARVKRAANRRRGTP